ncbi:MAG TPA: MgtC/SapB family protein [Planctomycetota bacterium]|nr:MgtC/SapB family protein [Planctomycetota bacterium]
MSGGDSASYDLRRMEWIYGNWRDLVPPPWAPALLALTAAAAGAVVGIERERRDKAAGLRTLVLVAVGASTFVEVSMLLSTDRGDPARVAAQVVSGVGFLGAGVILQHRGLVTGATTAASIWVTASIGMLAGAGYASGAVGIALLARFVLGALHWWEKAMARRLPAEGWRLRLRDDGGKGRVRFERILLDHHVSPKGVSWTASDDGSEFWAELTLRLPARRSRELLDAAASLEEVREIRPAA